MDTVQAGEQSMTAGKYEAAITKFELALEMDRSQPLAYVGLAAALSYQGKSDAAVDVAREAVKRRPNFGRAQLALAKCLCHSAETVDSPAEKSVLMDEALVSYDTATALNANIGTIPALDEWRRVRDGERLETERARNLETRIRRWEDSRERHGLAHIPYGSTSDSDKAALELEATTENGKRWKSEYYYAKRKY